MKTCWRCSTELDGNRCGNCKALNGVGDAVLNGIIRDDDTVTVYTTEDGPGNLLVELHKNASKLKSLAKPTRKNAIRSKSFKALWKLIVGDHPLLAQAEPQSYGYAKQGRDTYLSVEVHGLPAQPSSAPKPNGVPSEATAQPAAAEAPQAAAPSGPPPIPAEAQEAAPTNEAADAPQAAAPSGPPPIPAEATQEAAAEADAEQPAAEAQAADDQAPESAPDAGTTEEPAAEAAPTADAPTTDVQATDEPAANVIDAETPVVEAPPAADAPPEAMAASPDVAPPQPVADNAASADISNPKSLPLATLPESGPSSAQRLETLRGELAAFSGGTETSAALTELQARFEAPQGVRQLAENLLLCITTAQVAVKAEQQGLAFKALERAFALDPRNRVVLTEFGELLSQTGADPQLLLKVSRNLLLHHRNALEPAELSTVYRRIGQWSLDQGDLEKARSCFERALDAHAGDREALDLLLKTVEAEGDPEKVIKVRQRLLDQTRDPQGRAMLKVAIGDDYLGRLNDPDKAIEAYESALEEAVNIDALNKLAKLAADREDWSRAARIYGQLGDAFTAPDEKAEAWLRAGHVYRHRLWNTAEAAAAFEKCLDTDLSKLQAFKELTQLHADAENWPLLQGAYTRMAERVSASENPDQNLLAVLHRNLGELLRTHLNDRQGAIDAFTKAEALAPKDIGITEVLADLYAQADDTDEASLDAAIVYNRRLLDEQPSNFELLEKVARLHLRKQDFDQAYCIFRVLALLGKADEPARKFVETHTRPTLKRLKKPISPELYVTHLLGPNYDAVLGEAFDICREALTELLAHDLAHYGLRNKDRVDRQEGLMFNTIYRDVAEKLTFPEPPPVFKKDDLAGMINGSLYPSGFLVGTRILSGAPEKEVAFTIAKQLALFMNPSFLIQLRPLKPDLLIIFYTAVKLFRPEVNIQFNAAMQRVSKALQKLKSDRLDRLRVLMDQILTRKTKIEIQIRELQNCFEDAANRCGLIFCDDIAVCGQALSNEAMPVNRERNTDDRMRSLIAWSVSSQYHQIRKELGVAIDQ